MGHKVNPIGFRLGVIRTWDSKWFANRDYGQLLQEDLKIRKYIKERLYQAGVSKIEIERAGDKVRIYISTARPGIIIGRKGQEVEDVKQELQKITNKQIFIKIKEIRSAELDAQLVSESVALQIERRISYRRAMKRVVASAMKLGAKGIKIACAGRLGGAEMARREKYLEGRVPLHTLRADIDYGTARSKTTYGIVGVKVWIFHGEVLEKKEETEAKPSALERKRREIRPFRPEEKDKEKRPRRRRPHREVEPRE